VADPRGFLKHRDREIPKSRPVPVRLMDWKYVKDELAKDPEALTRQSGRCMDCGIPFCHQGCPLGNLIPEWNDLVWRGQWDDALDRLHATNNFPEFTGRICPAPCETSCVLGINQPAVTIKNIEVSIIDEAFERGGVKPLEPTRQTGRTIAIVGSGPSGLAAAQQLTRAGHTVAVYEKDDRLGGLMRYGVPDFKMEKIHIDRRVEQMAAEGTRFRTSVEIGKDIKWDDLRARFDAVLICTGSTVPRDLPIPGRRYRGIHYAMPYLTQSNKVAAGDTVERQITAKDKHVIIIGGGDTGTDCVGTSLRHGAKSVNQLEIMPRPPRERAFDNPWPQYPRVYKVDYGQEEAAAVYGSDPRHYCITAKRFIGDDQGRVKEVQTVNVEWVKDHLGRLTPREIPGTGRVWPAQLVLLAMGFTGPEDDLLDQLYVQRDQRTNAKAEYGKFTTNIKGVFAAGDMRRGQSLVVWAINEGRGAARQCDRYLTSVPGT